MPKTKNTAPEPEPVRLTRGEIMKAYAERQTKRGHKQVKIWVPTGMVPWIHRMADDLRTLTEMGFDPFTAHEKLPTVQPLTYVLLKRPDDEPEA